MPKPWEKYQSDGPWSKYQQPAAPESDDGFSVGEMVSNIPGSAKKMATDAYHAVTHPAETMDAIRRLGHGAAQKLVEILPELPADTSMMDPSLIQALETDHTAVAEAFGEALYERYGSVDNALNTLEQDPVGVLVDVAGVVTPLTPKGGAALNPINLTKNLAAQTVASATPKSLPARIYESVAKFGTTLSPDQRQAMIRTALKYEIAPTNKGVAALEKIIDSFDAQIDSLIEQASKGKTVPRGEVYRYLKDLKKDRGGFQFDAPGDLQVIDDILMEFEEYARSNLPGQVNAAELQRFKRGVYKRINFDAKHSKGTPAGEELRKTVARGAKDTLEELAPEVGDVNRQMGDALELQPHLQRSAGRIENRNRWNLGQPLSVTSGSVVGDALGAPGVGAALGTAVAALSDPKIRTTVALQLDKAIKTGALERFLSDNPGLSAAELVAILSGRTTQTSPQEEPAQ